MAVFSWLVALAQNFLLPPNRAMLSTLELKIFGPLWRSEDMKYVRITMQRDVSHEFTSRIGEAGIIEFVDVCTVFCE